MSYMIETAVYEVAATPERARELLLGVSTGLEAPAFDRRSDIYSTKSGALAAAKRFVQNSLSTRQILRVGGPSTIIVGAVIRLTGHRSMLRWARLIDCAAAPELPAAPAQPNQGVALAAYAHLLESELERFRDQASSFARHMQEYATLNLRRDSSGALVLPDSGPLFNGLRDLGDLIKRHAELQRGLDVLRAAGVTPHLTERRES